MTTTGKITGVNGNMITVKFDGAVAQNEVGYAKLGEKKLMAEIVRVRGEKCDMQVFESTTDLEVGTDVEFSGELLAAELGPGMLAQVYDGLQNPLNDLAEEAAKISKDASYFLQRGMYLPGLPRDVKWDFHPTAKVGDKVQAPRVSSTTRRCRDTRSWFPSPSAAPTRSSPSLPPATTPSPTPSRNLKILPAFEHSSIRTIERFPSPCSSAGR